MHPPCLNEMFACVCSSATAVTREVRVRRPSLHNGLDAMPDDEMEYLDLLDSADDLSRDTSDYQNMEFLLKMLDGMPGYINSPTLTRASSLEATSATETSCSLKPSGLATSPRPTPVVSSDSEDSDGEPYEIVPVVDPPKENPPAAQAQAASTELQNSNPEPYIILSANDSLPVNPFGPRPERSVSTDSQDSDGEPYETVPVVNSPQGKPSLGQAQAASTDSRDGDKGDPYKTVRVTGSAQEHLSDHYEYIHRARDNDSTQLVRPKAEDTTPFSQREHFTKNKTKEGGCGIMR